MDIIVMVICLLIASACFLVSYFQYREKGILLNNAYLYASREEREKMNKRPYYRQSGIVFSLLGIVFLLNAVQVTTEWNWICYLSILVSIVTIIYAVVSSILIEKDR